MDVVKSKDIKQMGSFPSTYKLMISMKWTSKVFFCGINKLTSWTRTLKRELDNQLLFD